MVRRATHKKRLGFQDTTEVLLQHIYELKILENKATQVIENALQRIEEQQNRSLEINPENYIKVKDEFLTQLQKQQEIHSQNISEIMSKKAKEQNKINQQTQELNLQLYEIQTEIKKISKVGFGRLPNYLVATLIGSLGIIVLFLLVLAQ